MKKIIFALMLITPLLILSGTSKGADRSDPPGIRLVQPEVVTFSIEPFAFIQMDYCAVVDVFFITTPVVPVLFTVAGEEPRSQEGSYPLKFSTFACVNCGSELQYSRYKPLTTDLRPDACSVYLEIHLPGGKMHRSC